MALEDEALGNSGPPHTIEHAGRTFRVRLIDLSVQTAFSRALLARARDVARELRELMTPDEFSAHLMALNADYVRGGYGLISPRGLEVISKPEGMLLLAGLIFDAGPFDLAGLFKARPEECTALVNLVVRESFPGIDWDAAGRAKGPGGTPAGNPDRPAVA
jgi:hypothetical protein